MATVGGTVGGTGETLAALMVVEATFPEPFLRRDSTRRQDPSLMLLLWFSKEDMVEKRNQDQGAKVVVIVTIQ